MAQGTPEEVAGNPRSFTGSYLKTAAFRNIIIKNLEGPAISLTDSEDIEVNGLNVSQEQEGTVIETEKCTNVRIFNSGAEEKRIAQK